MDVHVEFLSGNWEVFSATHESKWADVSSQYQQSRAVSHLKINLYNLGVNFIFKMLFQHNESLSC